ncbi:predicted protein [Lichtheimia corymbifera JMRC:FSU:9682]|uniref:Uncharacterized protein n=1 Tax=Lichtheimia corymbifera JMRC:FSU:9682 TaxID=1263082 RepID=A0A068S1U5_9FUNG|nr:predicted protein [Lichtheimia corymbifera JMRC:FSU:9682]
MKCSEPNIILFIAGLNRLVKQNVFYITLPAIPEPPYLYNPHSVASSPFQVFKRNTLATVSESRLTTTPPIPYASSSLPTKANKEKESLQVIQAFGYKVYQNGLIKITLSHVYLAMHIQKHKTSCPWYPHQDHQVVMRFSFKGPFLSQCPYSQVDINNKLFIHETYADDCDSLIIILEKCTKNMVCFVPCFILDFN